MEITHAFVTHTHPDHVGGGFAGMEIAGVTELLEKCKAKVVVHKAEAEFIKGLSSSDMIKSDNGDKIDVGGVEIRAHAHARPHAGLAVLSRRRPSRFRRHDVHRCLRTSGFPRRQCRADVLQLDAEADGAAGRHDSFSRPQLRALTARDDRRAEEDQSLPEIFFVETVLGGDGVSLSAVD